MEDRSDGTNKTKTPHPHPWAIQIATVAGIPIRLHFTFFLALLYFGGLGNGPAFDRILYVVAIFACIVLHELGHSLVALHFKIPVRDITLYPIGGVASIEKRPIPRQEFWIALAGPAVNVVIAVILGVLLGLPGHQLDLYGADRWRTFASLVFAANVFLVVFNAIPAFPMDGGRVLRAMLAMNMPADRATVIAAGIGQSLAIVLAIAALVTHGGIMLMLIAFFVFVGAGQEAAAYQQEAMVQGVSARQAMMTDVRTLSVGATLKEAADILLSTPQDDFPVVHGDAVQGVLTRDGLLRGLSVDGPDAYVAGIMDREYASVAPDEDLATAIPMLQESPSPILVLDPKQNGKLLGVINGDNIAEFLAVRRITTRNSAAPT